MSDVNKLVNADLECPFDPDQYNIGDNNITVPAGTSAWALSLVYLGKEVHRSGWNAPIEHMRLTHKSEVGSADDGAAYIEKSDKGGYWSRWQPTQEDLLACDWQLLESACPKDSMLVFDLNLGTLKVDSDRGQIWGYQNFGTNTGILNIIQNNIGIVNILQFDLWIDNYIGMKTLELAVSTDEKSDLEVKNLFMHKLYITVDRVTYRLGSPNSWGQRGHTHNAHYDYNSNIVKKLGEILKQTGQTKRFCLTWRDE
ncbi:DUF2829 domain-containing protein [Xenorhabdus bovienii]|uniref:Thoeris anti-defense Tad2 family protein n=1 Tax=Xenorhabdus bovienii TaxID=40576 RepID=UPI0023B31A01|nr:MW1434 family type I TA system toxin [Xenorhabdus bovienii]MDE9495511.1 DUF2829 domain-containing protein [Xenorhabdus bovienii]MDE9503935.1 DUF2829 domain-containing protein [Xenorhabdus bovienii]MDE9526739.1 DUF2829 domain-containing protein [Xenorhabdus bovienii]MDE9570357.1 DUF2829 domain-containing protein [Xenorhabdus bovienii]